MKHCNKMRERKEEENPKQPSQASSSKEGWGFFLTSRSLMSVCDDDVEMNIKVNLKL